MSRVFSPYDLILSVWNPLRNILKQGVDFERSAKSPIKLFITATNVAAGRARVFRNRDITPDVLRMIALLRQVAGSGREEGKSGRRCASTTCRIK
jgi:NTE family protein